MEWDVFICHAREDKDEFARPLAEALRNRGLKVWYDEFTLTLGDSLSRSIDYGLAKSRFGVVILSQAFFKKEWPQRELDGLTTKEVNSGKTILPIWHKVGREYLLRYSPVLAGKLAVSTNTGLDNVVNEIMRAVDRESALKTSQTSETYASPLPPIIPRGYDTQEDEEQDEPEELEEEDEPEELEEEEYEPEE